MSVIGGLCRCQAIEIDFVGVSGVSVGQRNGTEWFKWKSGGL